MDDDQVKSLTEMLKRLQSLAVPRCENVADELAYIACRDGIIEDALKCIGSSISNTDPLHFVSVNEQALAQLVLTRTFDSHKDLLRQQLKEAQQEAEKWRAIALAAEKPYLSSDNAVIANTCTSDVVPPRAKKLYVDCATQTEAFDVLKNSSALASNVDCELSWSLNTLEQVIVSLDQKIDVAIAAAMSAFVASPLTEGAPSPSQQHDSAPSETNDRVNQGQRARMSFHSDSNRKTGKKQAVRSPCVFDRLSARFEASAVKPTTDTEVVTPGQPNDQFLYAIRAMPLRNSRPKKSEETTLPSLMKK